MKKPLRSYLTIIFFLAYLLAVTWPVAGWVSAPLPLILGLPVSLAWSIAWILGGFVVLVIIDWLEERS